MAVPQRGRDDQPPLLAHAHAHYALVPAFNDLENWQLVFWHFPMQGVLKIRNIRNLFYKGQSLRARNLRNKIKEQLEDNQ